MLPIFLNLQNRHVLLVGGGEVAEEKLPKLLDAGAQIHLVTREIYPEVQILASRHPGQIRLELRPFEEKDVEHKFLVMAATDQRVVNQAIYDAAHQRGIWANVADKPELCDFFLTGTVKRGPIEFAISSRGTHPGLVRALRQFFEAVLPNEHLTELDTLSYLRQVVKEKFSNPKMRLAILRAITDHIRVEYLNMGAKHPETEQRGISHGVQ